MSTLFVLRRPSVTAVAMSAALLLLAGCEQIKSSSPLSPSIAGPIAGVTITPPGPVRPSSGQKVKDADQPISVVLTNAQSNSPRPFTMVFQIAADHGFGTVAFSQSGITPNADGTTKILLPARLQPGRVYYWRTMAQDGANSSDWSAPVEFEVLQPIVIGTPDPLSPVSNVRVTSSAPQLRVRNGVSSGPYAPLRYQFQVSQSQSFANLTAGGDVGEGGGDTAFGIPTPLPTNLTFFWRARITDGANTGAWSRVESFRSPLAVSAGGGGGGGGNGASCAASSGPAIVDCIAAKYPDKLASGVSSSTRQANMEFLRDRVIEAGKCGGLDLGWNLKRGGPEKSIDFITQRTGGTVLGIDIARDYDNTSTTLQLQWAQGDYPVYAPYPDVNCSGV